MEYLDINNVTRILKLIDIRDSRGEFDYENENTCEILLALYKQETISRYMMLAHILLKKKCSEIIQKLTNIIDVCNVLYYEYIKSISPYKKVSINKFHFDRENREKLKICLKAFSACSKVDRDDIENACGRTLDVVLKALKHDIVTENSRQFAGKHMMSKSEEKKSTELESIIDSQFTDLDKMLSLCFQVEYKQSKGKEMISMIKSSIYVIDFIESSKNFSENFLTSIKSYIAQEIKDVVKPKHSVDEIVERMKINILNAPELIIIQSTRPTKFDNRFKYIPFSFTVQDLLGDEADSLVGKDEYEISNIVSYSVGGPKFEILTKHSNGKWSGYADGTELTPTHVEFANILFSIEGNDPPCNSWCLVSRPVLLIFKKTLPKGLDSKSALYNENEVHEIYFDNEDEK